MHGSKSKNALGSVTFLITFLLAACGGDDGGNSKPAGPSGSSTTTGSTGSNGSTGSTGTGGSTSTTAALSISGAPNRQVIANQPYWFRPVANNASGASLR